MTFVACMSDHIGLWYISRLVPFLIISCTFIHCCQKRQRLLSCLALLDLLVCPTEFYWHLLTKRGKKKLQLMISFPTGKCWREDFSLIKDSAKWTRVFTVSVTNQCIKIAGVLRIFWPSLVLQDRNQNQIFSTSSWLLNNKKRLSQLQATNAERNKKIKQKTKTEKKENKYFPFH